MRGLLALGICPIAMADDDCGEIIIVSQPQSTVVEANCPVLFLVEVAGDGPFGFQWYRDGEAIPDATESSYTMRHSAMDDDSRQFHVVIENGCAEIVSEPARLTISMDNAPPYLMRARGDSSLERIIATFFVPPCGPDSRLYGPSAEDLSHYAVSEGLTIMSAVLDGTGTNVVLTTSRQSSGEVYTLTASGVSDLRGNEASATTQFQAWVMGADGETVEPPPVTIQVVEGDVWVDWPPGSRLQEAGNASGPWRELPLWSGEKPLRVEESAWAQFYRAVFEP